MAIHEHPQPKPTKYKPSRKLVPVRHGFEQSPGQPEPEPDVDFAPLFEANPMFPGFLSSK